MFMNLDALSAEGGYDVTCRGCCLAMLVAHWFYWSAALLGFLGAVPPPVPPPETRGTTQGSDPTSLDPASLDPASLDPTSLGISGGAEATGVAGSSEEPHGRQRGRTPAAASPGKPSKHKGSISSRRSSTLPRSPTPERWRSLLTQSKTTRGPSRKESLEALAAEARLELWRGACRAQAALKQRRSEAEAAYQVRKAQAEAAYLSRKASVKASLEKVSATAVEAREAAEARAAAASATVGAVRRRVREKGAAAAEAMARAAAEARAAATAAMEAARAAEARAIAAEAKAAAEARATATVVAMRRRLRREGRRSEGGEDRRRGSARTSEGSAEGSAEGSDDALGSAEGSATGAAAGAAEGSAAGAAEGSATGAVVGAAEVSAAGAAEGSRRSSVSAEEGGSERRERRTFEAVRAAGSGCVRRRPVGLRSQSSDGEKGSAPRLAPREARAPAPVAEKANRLAFRSTSRTARRKPPVTAVPVEVQPREETADEALAQPPPLGYDATEAKVSTSASPAAQSSDTMAI